MTVRPQRLSRIAQIAAVTVIAALAWPSKTHSHPHVWIQTNIDLMFDTSGMVTGINVEWQFDEFYSVTAIEGMDTNKNGTYEPGELEPLAKENIESLKEYRYFTQASANDTPIEYGSVTEYGSFVKDGYLSLYFSIPLKQPVDPRASKISFSTYDPTFYIAVELAPKQPIALTGAAPKQCRIVIAESEADAAENTSPEAFYEKLSGAEDIGKLYAKRISLDCARKTAAQ